MESWRGAVRSKGSGVQFTLEAKWALGAMEPGAGSQGEPRKATGRGVEGLCVRWGGGGTAGLGGRSDRARRKVERCWGQASQWRGASVQGTPHLDGKVAVPPLVFPRPHRLPEPPAPPPSPFHPASPAPCGRPAAAQPPPEPQLLLHPSPKSVRRK